MVLFEVLPETPVQVTKFGSTYRWHQNFLDQYVYCCVLEVHVLYIQCLQKVMLKVVQLKGAAIGLGGKGF